MPPKRPYETYSAERQPNKKQKWARDPQQDARKARCARILQLILGDRYFSGRVNISRGSDDAFSDTSLLADIWHNEDSLVYWTDASRSSDGCMGVGVVWKETPITKNDWHSESYKLGQNTGNVADAELFGMMVALKLAEKEVCKMAHRTPNQTPLTVCILDRLRKDDKASSHPGRQSKRTQGTI